MSATGKKRGRGRPRKTRVPTVEQTPEFSEESAITDSLADDEGTSKEERPKRKRRHNTQGTPPSCSNSGADPSVSVTGRNTLIPTDQVSLLIAAINKSSKKAMETQLAEFREEVKRSQQDMTDRIARKVGKSKTLEFKRKGNEDQFRFNEQLDDKLVEAAE